MLITRRKPGQWVTVTHAASGDVLRVFVLRVYEHAGADWEVGPNVDVGLDDPGRLFTVEKFRPRSGPARSGK